MVGGGGRRRSSPIAGLGCRWLGWVLRGRALAVGMLSFSSLSCCPQYQPLHDEVSHATGRHFHVRVGERNTLASTSSGLVIHLGRHVDSRARSPRISAAAASAFAAARPTLVTQSSATCSPGRPSLTPAPLCVVSVRARPSLASPSGATPRTEGVESAETRPLGGPTKIPPLTLCFAAPLWERRWLLC